VTRAAEGARTTPLPPGAQNLHAAAAGRQDLAIGGVKLNAEVS
jgi:hypothetical protein